MKYSFPAWVEKAYPSLIREISTRGASIPGFISLALGNPASEAIPTQLFSQVMEEVAQQNLMEVLQYGPNTGYPRLMEQTLSRLQDVKKYPADQHMLILLSGSSPGLGLVPRVLCRPGDVVYCDEFVFPNFANAVRYAGCKLVGISMDQYGMIPASLEEQCAKSHGKLLYVNPNFQNPTGATLTEERRREIYEIAHKYDLVIYEDDPYGEIRFRGKPVVSFKELDTDGRVIFAGSYSKTLSAGIRVGYLYGDKTLLEPVSRVKNTQFGQNPILNQIIVSKVLERIDFDAHLEQIRKIYQRKCDVMCDALRTYGPSDMQIFEPDGGMFVWVTFASGHDCTAIYQHQFEAGVGAVPSCGFAVDMERSWNAFRLNYTAHPDDVLVEGVKRFCALANKY